MEQATLTPNMAALDTYFKFAAGKSLEETLLDLYLEHGTIEKVRQALPLPVSRAAVQQWFERLGYDPVGLRVYRIKKSVEASIGSN